MIFVMAFSASAFANEFTDTEDHWAKHSIDYVTEEGYFRGLSATQFGPDMSMTRGMFVTVISRMSGVDISGYTNAFFTDVPQDEYYYNAVNWAYENGVVHGMGNGLFDPQKLITREQICLMLVNYLDYLNRTPEVKNSVTKYADNAMISSWAYDAVYDMQEYGYLIGSNNLFRPDDNATRAECASIFARVDGEFFDNNIVNKPDPNPGPVEGLIYLGEFEKTFYCPGYCCNGKWAGQTATGAIPTPGVTIAVDRNVIPLGSTVYIEFLDEEAKELSGYYIAQDVGGGVVGKHIDVLVATHEDCYRYGSGNINVYLVN